MPSPRMRPAAALAAVLLLLLPASAGAGILVADQQAFGGSGGVIRVNAVTGARATVSSNLSPVGGPSFVDPTGVALEPDGDILVVDAAAFAGAGGGVIRVNPLTGARTTVSENSNPAGGPQFVDPFGIALAANGDILVTDQNAFGGGGGVIRVNPVTGARTAVSQNAAPAGAPTFDAAWGIDTEASGQIVVSDPGAFAGGGGVIRVDPVTGARTAVSANASPPGSPTFSDPIGLVVAPGGDILVAESNGFAGTGGVIRVNPLTGARTTVSANSSPPGGPSFAGAIAIALEADGDILVGGFTANNPGGGVTRVNRLTGARTTVSENLSPAVGPSFAFPSGLAVEANGAPETTITGGPSGETRERTPTFSFSSSEPGSSFTCSVDGGARVPCSSPFETARLGPGSHSFDVVATNASGASDPTPATRAFRVLAVLSDLRAPVLGRSVNIEPVRGTVTVALPRGAASSRRTRKAQQSRARGAQKGLRFVPLREARQVPVGSFLDADRGTVRILAAGRGTQRSDFAAGLFQVLQARRGRDRGVTELRLKGSSFKRCTARGSAMRASSSRRRLSRRVVRRLRGNAKGRFRTRGRYSAATVRGTAWVTTDRCDGTLTRVTRGRVAVRDFRRKRNISVRAGKSYLAKARG